MAHDGLYGPETVTWRVNREGVLLLGGGRALLMQVAHPLVAAGVEQHSGYERDPWGRLYRTLDTVTKIVFGTRAESEGAAARLRRAHERVSGVSREGVAYDARDPDLLLWVWATLVDTSLVVYERCVVALSDAERERYYREQWRFARACGVPEGHWPATHAAFADYLVRMERDELAVGEDAQRIAATVVGPRVALPLRPAFAVAGLATVGLLPPGLRAQYGYAWGPGRERALALLLRGAGGVRPLLPPPLREFPAARRAAKAETRPSVAAS
ncbi:MAG TPA: oxygenase MpaB family protein [Solirubrobacteraceae bacterium]|nr:oxygenase MpaB family protein [Solirubrobacteraceae bacterium]